MSAQQNCVSTGITQPIIAKTVGRILAPLGRSAVVMFWHWPERIRQRRQLAAMDDRMLGDLGISRSDVEQEFRKAPWRI